MDFSDTLEEAAFRAEVRAFLEANAKHKPPGQTSTRPRDMDRPEALEQVRAWQVKKAAISSPAVRGPDPEPAPMQAWFREALLYAPGRRVAGGTDEILRNIIAERVLGLPAGQGRAAQRTVRSAARPEALNAGARRSRGRAPRAAAMHRNAMGISQRFEPPAVVCASTPARPYASKEPSLDRTADRPPGVDRICHPDRARAGARHRQHHLHLDPGRQAAAGAA